MKEISSLAKIAAAKAAEYDVSDISKKVLLPVKSKLFMILVIIVLLCNGTVVLAATKTWNRAAGGAWTSPANWVENSIPSAGDDVIIPLALIMTGAITDIPTISLNSLSINTNCTIHGGNNNRTVTITGSFSVPTGVVLTVGGGTNQTRPWSITLNSGASALVNGIVNVSTGPQAVIFTNSGTLTMGLSGVISSSAASFTLNSGATFNIGSVQGISATGLTGNIQVGGTRTYSAGAHYVYTSTANQSIGSGLPTNLTGTLTINSPGYVVTLDNPRTIANGGTVNIIDGTFAAGTNLTMSNTSTINRSGGTMTGIPQGSGAYNVNYTGNSMTTATELTGSGLNNISVGLLPGQTLTLDRDVVIGGNLSVGTGATLTLGTYTANRNVSGGTLAVSGTLDVSGPNNFPSNFSTFASTGGTVIFSSGGAQTIPAFNYNNLTSLGTGARILPATGTIGIAGTFTPGSNTYTVTGSTVAFNGSGPQTIPAFNYYNLTGGGLGTRTLASSGTIGIAGTFALGLSAYTVTGSTVDFNGSGPQSIPSFTFNNLITSNSAKTIPAGTNVTVNGTLTTNELLSIESESLISNGSLIVRGVSTGNVIYNRYLRADDYHFFASPVFGQAISGFPSARPETSVVEWRETDGTWPEPSETDFVPGKGYGWYLPTATIPGKVSFTGSLVTEAGPITATSPYSAYSADYTGPYVTGRDPDDGDDLDGVYGGGGWNLLGNPFTSALRITDEETDGDDDNDDNDFLGKNIFSFDPSYQAIYIYDGTVDPHGQYYFIAKPIEFEDPITGENPANSYFNKKYIQAGQGFFVLAYQNNVPFSFTADMRVHDTGVPMTKSAKVGKSWPGLSLKVKYGDKENHTTIIFNDDMSLDLDPGYDVGQLSTSPDVEIYTSLALKDNSVNYARQALPIADVDKIPVPVGIDSENGGEVTFSAYIVPLDNYKFWLEDKTTGTLTDLTTKSYTVTLPAKTYGTGRFFIIASTNTPTGIQQPEPDGLGIRVWTSNEKVIIKGEVSDKAICEIYDLRGKKLMETHLNDEELNTVPLPSGLHGVFLVRIVDGGKVTTRKVAIL